MPATSPSLRRPAPKPLMKVRHYKADVAGIALDDWLPIDVDPAFEATLAHPVAPMPAAVVDRQPGRVYRTPSGELQRWQADGRGTSICRHGERRWLCPVDGCEGGGRFCRCGFERARCPRAECRDAKPNARLVEALAAKIARAARPPGPYVRKPDPPGSRRGQRLGCEHGSNRSLCLQCGGRGLCKHLKPRSKCKDAECQAARIRFRLTTCGPCAPTAEAAPAGEAA